jgi:hypothetical protein
MTATGQNGARLAKMTAVEVSRGKIAYQERRSTASGSATHQTSPIEIYPCLLIKRKVLGSGDSGGMRCGHEVHAPDALDRRSPRGADPGKSLSATATDHGEATQQRA